jgi:rubrerythrin
LTLAKQAEDRETAVRAAMGFEKDTLLFFYDLRDMVSEKDRKTISAVIREEKKHLRRLAGML